jgi:hypothetical protein
MGVQTLRKIRGKQKTSERNCHPTGEPEGNEHNIQLITQDSFVLKEQGRT